MLALLSVGSLAHRTGAELFVRDLALALDALGHRVAVFAPVLGDMAGDLRRRSIACTTDLGCVTATPEVIIGSMLHETVQCLARFPGVPAISICHDRLAPHGRPPQFTRVRRHVAVDDLCRERLVLEHGVPEELVRVIHNGVDLARFPPRGPLPARAGRAAVFGNSAAPGGEIAAVAEACAAAGIHLDVIGSGWGSQASEPGPLLAGYDLVFAKARCAMEAMAVGCAVILLNRGMGLAGMVTPGNVEEWHRWNFGRRLLRQPIAAAAVREAIGAYSPAGAGEVSRYVRSNCTLEQTAAAFARLAEEVVAEEAGRPPVEAREEIREFARCAEEASRPAGPHTVPVQVGMLLERLEQAGRAREGERGHERAVREALRAERDALRAERDLLAERWELVQRSLSWRITAPLRRVAGSLGWRR